METLESQHRTASFAIPLAFFLTVLNTFLGHPDWLHAHMPDLLWDALDLSKVVIWADQHPWVLDGVSLLVLGIGVVAYYPRKQMDGKYALPWPQMLFGLIAYIGGQKVSVILPLDVPILWTELALKLSGLLALLLVGVRLRRLWHGKGLLEDRFNHENETFAQSYPKLEMPYSINIPYRYRHQGRERKSWINLINPFRSTMVIGTTGSGKSFGVIEEILRQWIEKGYPLALYDFKFPTQSQIAYNYLQWYATNYGTAPGFYVINLDDPAHSHCCNPLDTQYLEKQQDAINMAIALLYNINRKWVEKKGEFFVDSPIVYVAALIWYLKLASEKTGKYLCTLPHVLVLAQQSPEPLFELLQSEPEVKLLINTFKDALDLSAMEQLAGQTGSANIGLSQLVSKELFFIMGRNNFSLRMNDPMAPKLICFGNHPARKEAYSAPLGVYLSTLVREVNRQGQLPSALFLDELPTLYILGLDDFIATVRSNKVATIMGIQNLAQLARDYGQRVADAIAEISGNIIVGQVTFGTAKKISELFGKIKQQRQSVNTGHRQQSINVSTQLDALLPPSKLAQLSQGSFAGILADSHALPLPNKLFHGKTVMDMELKAKQEELELPLIHDFRPEGLEGQVDFWMGRLNASGIFQELGAMDTHGIMETTSEIVEKGLGLLTKTETHWVNLVDNSLLDRVLANCQKTYLEQADAQPIAQRARVFLKTALLAKNKEKTLQLNFQRIENEVMELLSKKKKKVTENYGVLSEVEAEAFHNIQENDYLYDDGTPSETFVFDP